MDHTHLLRLCYWHLRSDRLCPWHYSEIEEKPAELCHRCRYVQQQQQSAHRVDVSLTKLFGVLGTRLGVVMSGSLTDSVISYEI